MIQLPQSLAAWKSADFAAVLKREIEALPPAELPLAKALVHGNWVSDEPISVTLLASHADSDRIQARVGLLFRGMVAGCNCADDPSPLESHVEQCELLLSIDRQSGNTTVELLDL